MRPRFTLGASLLLLLLPARPLSPAPPGARVDYAGGTLAQITANAGGRLLTSDPDFLVFIYGPNQLRVPYHDVNLLEYGQNASRRYVLALTISPLLLLSKARRHFLTIGFQDPEGRQQALVFRVHKNDVRALLASLEARTGRRVEYQDPETRASGVN